MTTTEMCNFSLFGKKAYHISKRTTINFTLCQYVVISFKISKNFIL